jgi:hypothetical protein
MSLNSNHVVLSTMPNVIIDVGLPTVNVYWLLDLSPADFRRFLTVLVDRHLIRSTKMANNRHAYNRDVLQSYWTSDGLPLYCSQPTGEKIHTNQQCERLAKIRQTTGNIWSERLLTPWLKSRWFQTVSNCSCWQTSIGQPVLFEYGTGCKWHPSNQTLQCHVVTIRWEQLETVWNQRDLSQGELLNVHCWQTDIDEHVWHGV